MEILLKSKMLFKTNQKNKRKKLNLMEYKKLIYKKQSFTLRKIKSYKKLIISYRDLYSYNLTWKAKKLKI